jgi:AcrR family transcriptional regulator
VTADDSNDNRSRILDAAATEFMNAGFDATSIDDIARRIGQTKGLIYYHFRSKIDIFYAVYERGMRQVRDEVAPQVSAPGTGMERLRRMARAHVADLLLNLGYHDVMRQGVEKRMRMCGVWCSTLPNASWLDVSVTSPASRHRSHGDVATVPCRHTGSRRTAGWPGSAVRSPCG